MTLTQPRLAPEPATSSSAPWFWWAIAAITLAQIALRGWAAGGGWFYWDDFWWHDIVASHGLWETAGMSLGGHYSPLTYIPYYLLTATFPYEWLPRLVVMLGTLLGINTGVLAVTRRLWPTRGPQLAVYTLWAFSTMAAPSWLWYSQFSMMGALLLTSTWTLWAYLRALSTRQTRDSVLAVVLLAVSLFAQERMLVLVLLMGLFLVAVCKPTLKALNWTRRRGLWLSSATVVAVWMMVYLRLPQEPAAPASGTAGMRLVADMLRVSGMPALLGGPWMLDEEPVLRRAATPAGLQLLAVIVLAGLLCWSLRIRRGAWRPWAILGLGLVIDAALVTAARGATMGPLAVGEWRYFSDLSVLAPVLIVAAFVAVGTVPDWSPGRRRTAIGALSVFTLSALITTIPLGFAWHESLSRPFVTAGVRQLHAAGPALVMDTFVPETVVNPVLGQQRLASRVFSITDPPVTFEAAGTEPLVFDPAGNLVPATVSPARRSALSGPCAYAVDGVETTWIPLSEPPGIGHWGVAVDYVSDTPVTAVITDGALSVDARIPQGAHTLYVPLGTRTQQVGVHLTAPGVRLCIDEVRVGTAQPR